MDLPANAVESVVTRLRSAGCVFAEDEAAILIDAALTEDELGALVARRVTGDPLEYLVGWTEFYGLRVRVSAGVFVPRQRTRLMVDAVLRLRPAPRRVLDLCCGAGAIGWAIASHLAAVEVVAVDIDPVAVDCAKRNLAPVKAQCYCGDLFDALPNAARGGFDVIVANAPYVPTDAIQYLPPEARLFEPAAALDGGRDGLDIHRRIASAAPAWLAPRAALLIETSSDQAPAAAAILVGAGLTAAVITDDELSATVVIGRSST